MYKLQVKLAETWPAGLAEASRQALHEVHATWAECEGLVRSEEAAHWWATVVGSWSARRRQEPVNV